MAGEGRAGRAGRPRAEGPALVELAAGTRLARIYNPDRHRARELSFRRNGPRLRFDHQRPHDGPADDPERGIWYGARELETCAVEVFGPLGEIELRPWRLALPHSARTLRLLDLRGDGPRLAGAPADVCRTPDRRLTWSWSRRFHEDGRRYGRLDGLIYPSSWTGADCLALYERPEDALECPERCSLALTHPRVTDALLRIAGRRRLAVRP